MRVVLAGIALGALLSGCAKDAGPQVASLTPTGPGSEPTASSPGSAKVVAEYVEAMRAYVRCFRSHGLPQMPDPNELGSILIDSRKVTIDPAAFRRAELACRDKARPVPAEVKRLLDQRNSGLLTDDQKEQARRYAACMQTHGAPDFPDPGANGLGDEKLWNQTSAGAARATEACAAVIGDPINPGPGVG